jgi:hypothetical protein
LDLLEVHVVSPSAEIAAIIIIVADRTIAVSSIRLDRFDAPMRLYLWCISATSRCADISDNTDITMTDLTDQKTILALIGSARYAASNAD